MIPHRLASHLIVSAAVLVSALSAGRSTALAQDRPMVQLIAGGRWTTGTPLYWDGKTLHLLERDGRLSDVTGAEAIQAKPTGEQFAPMDHADLQAALIEEFGDGFDVSGSGQYLVVYPSGQPDKWAGRFEALYRSMTHYFSTRGIEPIQPMFPLVAIVFPNQGDFLDYAESTGAKIDSSWLGYYSVSSNRIAMYDFQRSGGSDEDWLTNASTIVHEAAHQTAYNIGVHSRWVVTPRWLAEGLGTLFEAPGVYDAARHSKQTDRINQQQLAAYRRLFPQPLKSHTLLTLLSDDRTFDRNGEKSYAISWALMLMLSEQQPMEVGEYLRLTAARPPFVDYAPADRIADFQSIFGDIPSIQLRLEQFVRQLP